MFSSALIACPHEGQRDRGVTRLKRSRSAGASPRSSSAWSRHSFSIICGRRAMTTLRKLPISRPSTSAEPIASGADSTNIDRPCIVGVLRRPVRPPGRA